MPDITAKERANLSSMFFSGRLITSESVIMQNIILNVAPAFLCKNRYGAVIFFTLRLRIGSSLLQTRSQERGLAMLIEY